MDNVSAQSEPSSGLIQLVLLRDNVQVTGYREGSVVSRQLQPVVAPAPLHGLPELKATQYEATCTGKHCKSREIHNLRGRALTEAATTLFFSSEI